MARLSEASGLIFVGGFVFGNTMLMIAAGALIVGMALFALVTFPVEIQAGRAAVDTLEANAMVQADELPRRSPCPSLSRVYLSIGLGQRLGFIAFLVVGAAIAKV